MARLWSCGFELQTITTGVEFTVVSGTPTIDTTLKRSGNTSLKAKRTTSGTVIIRNIAASSVGFYTFFARAYINITTLPSALCMLIHIWDGSANAARIRLATDGTLELWDNSVKIGSSSSPLSPGTWYRLELKYQAVSGSANDVMEARLDGTTFASTSTGVGPSNGFDRVEFGLQSTITTGEVNFDDLAINNNSGSYQNSWPGSEKIIHLNLDSAGDSNSWLKSDGGAGDANNYTQVDEITPDDATTYLKTETLNDSDLYNCGASGLSGSDTINVVQVGVRFACSFASYIPKFKVQIEKSIGGTKSYGLETQPTTTSWKTNIAGSGFNYPLTLYLDPDNVNPWTNTTLDSMQIGMLCSLAGSNYDYISTVWVLVGYVPYEGPPPVTIQESLKYCVISTPSTKTKSLKYTVKTTPATIQKSLHYIVAVPTTIQKSLIYKVKASVSPVQKSLKYTVKTTPSTIQKSLKYTVKTTPTTPQKSLVYKVKATQAPQKSLKYTVKTTPSIIQKTLVYRIKSFPTFQKSLKYVVKTTPSTIQKSLTYKIIVVIQKSLKYTIIVTPTAIQKSLKYAVRITPTAIQKELTYLVVITPSTIQKSLTYKIVSVPTAIEKLLKYTITIAPSAIQKSLEYKISVVTPTTIQKTLKYTAVITPSAITQSLKYTVRITPSTIQKGLTYIVAVPITITKSLKYVVFVPVSITKSLRYELIIYVDKYTTKGTNYQEKYGLKGTNYVDKYTPKDTIY